MKVQDLLAEYLYQNKTLILPSIGSFELNPAVNVYETKEDSWPEDAITFTQNNNAVADDNFVSYLVQHSGKMKPLALSDLDSYISNGIQFLNIGKPFTLKGIGALTKTGNQLNFQQGRPVIEKTEQTTTYVVKDRTRQKEEIKELNFDSETKKGNSRKLIIALASIIALLLIAVAIYLAIPKTETSANEEVKEEDTTSTTNIPVDTAQKQKETVVTTPPVTDSLFHLLVFSYPDSVSANKRIANLKMRGFDVSLLAKDSAVNVILHVKRPLADTTYVMDSLRKNYLWKPKFINQ